MLSFNFSKRLFRGQDEFAQVDIREKAGLRWMHFGGKGVHTAIKCDAPADPQLQYIEPLIKPLAWLPHCQKVLLLGLGGGGIVHYLQATYPDCHITCIERSALVIRLAHDYFRIDRDNPHLRIIQADASTYLTEFIDRFDVVLLDLCGSDYLPKSCTSFEFFQNCFQLLNNPGLLAANFLLEANCEFLEISKILRSIFQGQTITYPLAGFTNVIHLSLKSDCSRELYCEFDGSYKLLGPTYDSTWGLLVEGLK